ncbi:hypothetical protein J4411_01185 [Candidatus Pacearchaeota archaeon]|nr:hypothetical protein [uncultured archaeon]MBS3084508.1 hypothetical protein [Candidatus Pacearchaeota archaeon]
MVFNFSDFVDVPKEYMFGGILGALIIGAILFAVIFLVALYVYHSLSWQEIGKKQKYKHSWLAWIPFANISMIFEMGGFHWAWIFLVLIPFAGWIAILIIFIISIWRIFEKEKYPGWFSLSAIIPKVGWILYLIAIGFVAWGKGPKKNFSPEGKSTRRKKRK